MTLVLRFPTLAKTSPRPPWAVEKNQMISPRRSLKRKRKMRKTKMAKMRKKKTRKRMKEWRRTTTPTSSGKLDQSPSTDDAKGH